MVIDGFDEILNTLYIAKRLYDMGRYEVAEANFFDIVDYDVYYENMYGLIENIFETVTASIMKSMAWKSMCCQTR